MKVNGNGLVEIYGEKTKERGFFCMKLLAFLNTEAEPGTEAYAELWEQRFNEAKLGACAYRGKCPIYARTAKKGIQRVEQLLSEKEKARQTSLFGAFDEDLLNRSSND